MTDPQLSTRTCLAVLEERTKAMQATLNEIKTGFASLSCAKHAERMAAIESGIGWVKAIGLGLSVVAISLLVALWRTGRL
jgi:hypothetical protein